MRRHFSKTKTTLRITILYLYLVGQHRTDPVQRGAVYGAPGPARARHHILSAPARVRGLPRSRPRMESNIRGMILYLILPTLYITFTGQFLLNIHIELTPKTSLGVFCTPL